MTLRFNPKQWDISFDYDQQFLSYNTDKFFKKSSLLTLTYVTQKTMELLHDPYV